MGSLDRDALRLARRTRPGGELGWQARGRAAGGRHLDDEHLGGKEQRERQADHELGFAHAEDARPTRRPQVSQKLRDAKLALQTLHASSKTRVPPDRSRARRIGARLLRRVSCGRWLQQADLRAPKPNQRRSGQVRARRARVRAPALGAGEDCSEHGRSHPAVEVRPLSVPRPATLRYEQLDLTCPRALWLQQLLGIGNLIHSLTSGSGKILSLPATARSQPKFSQACVRRSCLVG